MRVPDLELIDGRLVVDLDNMIAWLQDREDARPSLRILLAARTAKIRETRALKRPPIVGLKGERW